MATREDEILAGTDPDQEERRALISAARARRDKIAGGIERVTGPAEAFARGAAQGATFEFGDEISAGIRSLRAIAPGGETPGEAFTSEVGEVRARNAAARVAHPVASALGNVAGAIATTGGTALVARGTAAGARMGLGRLAALGAAEGAVAATGAGEGGLLERLPGAAAGGAVGLVAGAALPAAGRVAGSAVRRGLDVSGLRPVGGEASGAIGRIGERIGLTSTAQRTEEGLLGVLPEGEELAQLRSTLEASQPGPGFIGPRLRDPELGGRIPEPLSLMDVDPNFADIGRAARQIPGRARREIPAFTSGRVATQQDAILQDAFSLSGFPDNPDLFELQDEILTRQAANAEQIYGPIRGIEVDAPEIGRLLTRPAFKKAYAEAENIAANAGNPLPAIEELVDEAGNLRQPITLGVLDQVKRGLDDVLAIGKRTGLRGPTGARTIRKAKNEFIDILDRAVPSVPGRPGYAAARSAFAGESALLEALEQGENLFKLKAPEAERILAEMGESEREMFVRGGLSALNEKVEGIVAGFDATKRLPLRNAPTDRRRLRLLFPDDQAFQQYERTIAEQAQLARTNRIVTGGSDTIDKATGLANFLGISPFSVRGVREAAVGESESRLVRQASEALIPRLTATGTEAVELVDRLTALRGSVGRRVGGAVEVAAAGAPAVAAGSLIAPAVGDILGRRARQRTDERAQAR